ncbi:MAG: glycosyltransferase [Phycisphaerales bacterium]|nr:glycosyltransferase [Phycisphaerae bacterium]NNF44445.1 glycosyltransferase [Phycisphaerales bacterium]NNM25074.1 glycosyltransferase [Phycisphaerales bacterium]
MISYLIPTRHRPDRLAATLTALARLDPDPADPAAEVIVVDDASETPVTTPTRLANGWAVRVVRCETQCGAAARNAGVEAARGAWIFMLDDDSWPLDTAANGIAATAGNDVAAIGGQILLPGGHHEHGGLPEVFVGCGVLLRRDVFLDLGGYDDTFHYYAEEYDYCARLIRAGWRVRHDWRLQVRHEKVAAGRRLAVILRRLVRNNGWVAQRYAPEKHHQPALEEIVERYARIAAREGVAFGYQRGLDDLMETIDEQPRVPLTEEQWQRFTGATAVEEHLAATPELAGHAVAIVDEGKHANVIRRVLLERGGCMLVGEDDADRLVIGTLSPGPMLDAWERHHRAGVDAWMGWRPDHAGVLAG